MARSCRNRNLPLPSRPACLGLLVLVVFCQLAQVDGADECKDHNAGCGSYTWESCKEYPNAAKEFCPKTCGICTGKGRRTCPNGWTLYSGNNVCLKVFGADDVDKLSFSFAKDRCNILGGRLAIIRDQAKNNAVRDLVPAGSYAWIGLENVTKKDFEFVWRFVDMSPLGSFHPWKPNNPDDYEGNEKCVTLDRDYYDGYWNDLNCDARRAYVCELN